MKFSFEFVHSKAANDSTLVVEHEVFAEPPKADGSRKNFAILQYPGKRAVLIVGSHEIPLKGLETHDFSNQSDIVLLGFKPGARRPDFIGFAKVEVRSGTATYH